MIPRRRYEEPITVISVIAAAAELLYRCGEPGSGARLREEHANDESGRCRGCPHAGTVAPKFPCRLRLVGEAAARLGTRSTTNPEESNDDRR